MASKSLLTIACIFISLASYSSDAATITPVSVDASTTWDSYNKDNLINNSGLVGALHSDRFSDMWMSNFAEPNSASITFDLGEVYSITSTDIWQYNYVLDRGIQTFDIYGSMNGVDYSLITGASLLISPGGRIPAQNIVFNSIAQFIRFNVTSNYGGIAVGLSEVKFQGDVYIPQIPVPAAVWLFGSGLIGLIGVTRRKKP